MAFNTGIGRFLLRPSPKAAKLVLPRSFIKNVVHKLNLDITEIVAYPEKEETSLLLINIPKNWLSILTQGDILISKMPINGHRFALIYLHALMLCVRSKKSSYIAIIITDLVENCLGINQEKKLVCVSRNWKETVALQKTNFKKTLT